jgi:predicted Fe-Mo cluster-binding NifX family protein
MKVALTAWEDRISPVFDSAKTLLIAEIENAEIVARRYAPINPESIFGLGKMLRDLEIDILICGAISRTPSDIIEAGGITLISFIGGDVEEVLECFAKGERIVPAFLMPGCGRNFRMRKRGRDMISNRNEEVSTMPNKDGTGPAKQGPGTGQGRGGCQPGQGGGQGTGTGQGGKCGGGRGKGQGGGQGRRGGQGKGVGGKGQN